MPIRPGSIPKTIEYSGGEVLQILWSDGTLSAYSAQALRAGCPCAVCNEARKKLSDRAVPPSVLETIRVIRTAPVGRYGLKITWSDGHDTGIYTYENLQQRWSEREAFA